MTEIVIIAAVAQNRAIGKDNDIPWHIKEDFLHFKNKTNGFPIIMGDKTFDSLPKRPLPGRENIVCTLDKDYRAEATLFYDFKKAIRYVREKKPERAYIIGGASIYRLGMDVADTLEITKIYKDYDADTFFPHIDPKEWQIVEKEDHKGIDIKNNVEVEYSFITYNRKTNK